MNRRIIVAADVDAQSRHAAELMADRIRQAVAARGRCVLALSGGSSVRAPYRLLAAQPNIDWSRVFLFWGDDRFVDHTNPYSSFALAQEVLIRWLPNLPKDNVFPVPVDATNPSQGARQYSEIIRGFFKPAEGEWPRFDLMQNGMGQDGHTASLFPHSAVVGERVRIARMAHAGQPPWVDRVTLTVPVFCHARCVLFIASGSGKAAVLKTVLEGGRNSKHWPAQAIEPVDGEVIWLLDPTIASGLSGPVEDMRQG